MAQSLTTNNMYRWCTKNTLRYWDINTRSMSKVMATSEMLTNNINATTFCFMHKRILY
jgi:hypothetical protein